MPQVLLLAPWEDPVDPPSFALSPQVPECLRAHFETAVSCGRIRSMQNSMVTASPLHAPGALLLGDAFNMRHPLTGVLGGNPGQGGNHCQSLRHLQSRHAHRGRDQECGVACEDLLGTMPANTHEAAY